MRFRNREWHLDSQPGVFNPGECKPTHLLLHPQDPASLLSHYPPLLLHSVTPGSSSAGEPPPPSPAFQLKGEGTPGLAGSWPPHAPWEVTALGLSRCTAGPPGRSLAPDCLEWHLSPPWLGPPIGKACRAYGLPCPVWVAGVSPCHSKPLSLGTCHRWECDLDHNLLPTVVHTESRPGSPKMEGARGQAGLSTGSRTRAGWQGPVFREQQVVLRGPLNPQPIKRHHIQPSALPSLAT